MKKNKININREIKYLAKPVSIFTLVLFLVILTFTIGIGQIKKVNDKRKTAGNLQATLSKNLSTLRSATLDLQKGQNFIDVVLPASNSPLYFINQIRTQVDSRQLILTNIRTGSTIEEGSLSKSGVSFDVEGPVDQISSFIDDLSLVLPLSNIDKVKTSFSGDLAKSSLTINVYSSEMPKKIPPITSPITELTSEEKEILTELTGYTLPNFVKPKATTPTTREDPFN